MIDLVKYGHTNFTEKLRLENIKMDKNKSLDRVIAWLLVVVIIAFVLVKDRV